MYVCLCEGVTDREIADAKQGGACTIAEIMRCTGAGTRCGSCQPTIATLLSVAPEGGAEEGAPRRLPVVPSVPSAA